MVRIDNNRPKAVVLGTTPNALGVVRSLGRKGIQVVAVGPEKGPAMFSRYCESVISPDPETEIEAFLESLLCLGKKLRQPGILFPTGDAYVHFVSENREDLTKYFKFALPEKQTMRRLLSKNSQYRLAEKIGIPLPRTYYPRDFEDLKEISGRIVYPAVIKASDSTAWRRSYKVQKVIYARSPGELLSGYQTTSDLSIDIIVQEVVLGDDDRHYKICAYMDEKSRPIRTFTLKKIRNFPYHFGVGSIVESRWLPDVAELGLKFLRGVRYVGIGSIEFKRDERDDRLKMIELNSRLWLQNSLADRCGMNFPYTMYRDLVGERVEEQSKFKQGIKWVSMRMDYASFRQYHKDGELTYAGWLRSLRGKKILEVYAWDDPKPFFHSTGYGLKFLSKGLGRIKRPRRLGHPHQRIPASATSSKRVLHLISSKGLFGAENVVLQLAKESVEFGIRPFIGVFENLHSPHTEIADEAQRMNIDTRVFSCRGKLDVRTIIDIRGFLRAKNIDILHSHGYKANIYGLLATSFMNIRRVATCHNWLGKSAKMRGYGWLDKSLLDRFDKVVAVSDALRKEVLKSGVTEEKVAVYSNGVAVDKFCITRCDSKVREEFGIQENERVVGTIGRLSEEKGHTFLLKAAKHLLSSYPNVKFLIVGDGPLKASLHAAIHTLKLEGNVIFTGARKDISDLLGVMDVFVLASLVEGTPMALLEAMAARKPIVATPVGAVPKVVQDGYTGLLVEPGDARQLSRAVLFLLQNDEKANFLAQNAYAKVRSEFSAQKMAEKYASAYHSLLGTPGAVRCKGQSSEL